MRTSLTFPCRALLLVAAAVAPCAQAADPNGNLAGWVEDARGLPVSGAVISLFGSGIGAGGLVTLSDSAGRFVLPSLPAGSYTLRALSGSELAAPARQVTVLPAKDSVFSISLLPTSVKAEADKAERVEASRELRWLVRHKRRSVLDSHDQSAVGPDDPETLSLPDILGGSVEVVAAPLGASPDPAASDVLPGGLGVLRLEGRLASLGHWSLGGLVAESEDTTWRMAAEFVIEPGGGHTLRAGSGYGLRFRRGTELPEASVALHPDSRNLGAMFVEDRWRINDRLLAQAGLRYSFVGFVQDGNTVDPSLALEARADDKTRLHGAYSSHTLVPGGDFLTLSSLSASPMVPITPMPGLRPERVTRTEIGMDHLVGGTTVGLQAFREGERDRLVNAFASTGVLDVSNGPGIAARGLKFVVARRLGSSVKGSVSYTFGRASRQGASAFGMEDPAADGTFQDVSAEVETFVDSTGTHVAALYRVHRMRPDAEGGIAMPAVSRFDLQLTQGLPFLANLTRADWELLVAFRNLLYEGSDEAGMLDEVAVVNPPKRIVGGISVRF